MRTAKDLRRRLRPLVPVLVPAKPKTQTPAPRKPGTRGKAKGGPTHDATRRRLAARIAASAFPASYNSRSGSPRSRLVWDTGKACPRRRRGSWTAAAAPQSKPAAGDRRGAKAEALEPPFAPEIKPVPAVLRKRVPVSSPLRHAAFQTLVKIGKLCDDRQTGVFQVLATARPLVRS